MHTALQRHMHALIYYTQHHVHHTRVQHACYYRLRAPDTAAADATRLRPRARGDGAGSDV